MQSNPKAGSVIPMWRKPDRFQRPSKRLRPQPQQSNRPIVNPVVRTAPNVVNQPQEVPIFVLQDKLIEQRFTRQSIYQRRTNTLYTDQQLNEASAQSSRKVRPTLNFGRRHKGQGWNVWQRVMEPSAVVRKAICRDPLGGAGGGSGRELDTNGQPLKDICLVRSSMTQITHKHRTRKVYNHRN